MDSLLSNARTLFNVAHENKSDCQQLIDLTNNLDESIIRGYHAAALMVSSKYLINPFKLLAVFNAGKNLLEDLISENFEDVELRYLRYAIQLNTPKFAGYYKNIKEDRLVITHYLKANPHTELSQHITIFLTNTNDVILKDRC